MASLKRMLSRMTVARCRRPALMLAVATAALGCSTASHAQNLSNYFPSGNWGYDQQLGVTVLTRARPLYEAPGIRAGGFLIYPRADQGLFYNSNLNGTTTGSGTWGSSTGAGVSAFSDWNRDRLGATVGVDHQQFFSFPNENFTNWNAGLTGGYTIDESLLNVSYYHQLSHSLGTTIAAVASQVPFANQSDTARIDYTFNFARLAITPDISATSYRLGSATVAGTTVDLSFLDRNALAGGVTARYSMSDEGGLLVVVRGISSVYTKPQPGVPSNNSNSFLVLGGIDYQAKSVWRYRLLAGMEVRQFQAAQFATRTAPIAEASVIWTPTGVTTVTGSLSRLIEDPESGGTNGYVLTQAQVVVDHELRRNVIVEAHGGVQYAQFLQGGSQTSLTAGVGATWLMNRNLRLSAAYNLIKQTGSNTASNPSNPTTITSGQFNQNLVGLTLHLAL
jgi:hypothetical protein